jgi:mRNA-degrading endonuclease toxin of MazEF toxin-antitoxin module
MAAFNVNKFDVVLTDLPVQVVSQKGENGKTISVTGTEMHGPHECVVVSVDENKQWLVVVPMTSATDSRGGEKWQKWSKSWARVQNDGKYAAVLCEQIRYISWGRLMRVSKPLGDYDQQQVETKLRNLLGL